MEIRHVVNEGFFIFGKNGDELAKLTYRKEGEKLYFESTVVSSELCRVKVYLRHFLVIFLL